MKTTFHAIERTQDRIFSLDIVNVGFEPERNGKYKTVGTIKVTDQEKERFRTNLKKLQSLEVGTRNMVVELFRFNLRHSNINWKSDALKAEAQTKSLTIAGDRDDIQGNGDVAFAFVVKGVLKTIITVKNYTDIAKKFEKVNGNKPIVVKNINKFKPF